MKIIPAIDLRFGQCVRLEKGRFEDVTHYDLKPEEVAKNYEAAGSDILHVVDLDGAKTGSLAQTESIQRIRESTNMDLQVGGGVSSIEVVEMLLSIGVTRVVIGSMAIKQVPKTEAIFKKYGADKIVLALDVHINDEGIPMVATHGWQAGSDTSLDDAIKQYQPLGLKHVLCTDISKDGMLSGPNFVLYRQCVEKYPDLKFQASGGISQLKDFDQLIPTGVSGVIVGKALYEKRFTLREAIERTEIVDTNARETNTDVS